MIIHSLLAACLGTLILLAPVGGQALPQTGDVVRGRLDGTMVQGYLVEAARPGEPLQLSGRAGAPVYSLPWDTPELAQRIRPGRKTRAALIGLAVGAVSGAAIGFMSGDDECGTGWFGCLFVYSAEEKAVMAAGTLGVVGLLAGAIAGRSAEWSPIGPPVQASRIGLHLSPRGVGIRYTF